MVPQREFGSSGSWLWIVGTLACWPLMTGVVSGGGVMTIQSPTTWRTRYVPGRRLGIT